MGRMESPTFAEYAKEWLAYVEADGRSPGSMRNYRSYLSKWLLPAFGQKHLTSITEVDILRLSNKMLVETGKVQRAHTYHTFQTMMKMSYATFRYLPHPWSVSLPGVGGDRSRRPETFTMAQAMKVIDVMPEYQREPLLVMVGASLRIGELCGLNIGDYDPEHNALTVARQLSLNELTATKTREVGIVFPIFAAPKILRARKETGAPNTDPMFRGPRGARLNPTKLRYEWDRARRIAGLPTMRVHDLRHVGLTEYARLGVTMTDVKEHGRHKSMKSVERYQHANEADRREALSRSAIWD